MKIRETETEKKEKVMHLLTTNCIECKNFYFEWMQDVNRRKKILYDIQNKEEKVVGNVLLGYCSKYVEIISIYIYPNYRNRGYAKITLRNLFRELGKKNVEYAVAYINKHNLAGRYIAFTQDFVRFPEMENDIGEINIKVIQGYSNMACLKELVKDIIFNRYS